MKRITLIPALVIIALIFFSCEKKGEARAPVGTAFNGSESRGQQAAADGWGEGYVLRVNSPFYGLVSDTGSESDRTRYDSALSLGEKVSVKEIRRATFHGDGVAYDFAEIRRESGSEGLAFASQVAKDGSIAVVTDERANLFSSPRAVDVTGTILPRGTVAVWFPETERDGFVEIRAYNSTAQSYTRPNTFVRLTSLSRREADIQSSILLQTAQPLGNTGAEKVRKDALLEMALMEYPDSVFSAEIMAVVYPNAAAVISTESVSRPFMSVNGDNVDVRDLPDPVAGKVVGRLAEGDEVTVSEQTTAMSTVGGQSAHWYRITEPLEGWVFGAYLE